jgi:hypothetical protein
MPEYAPDPSFIDILPEIEAGSDIWVVLRNRFGELKYVESYHLTNILMSGDRFWGKFREIHASHGLATLTNEAFNRETPMAFAYNNFAPVVCSLSMTGKVVRLFSANAYAEMRFIATRRYTRLWEMGGDTAPVTRAVLEGRPLKLMIRSSDDYLYSIPIHTVEATEDQGFAAYTWFDGYPEVLRYFEGIMDFGVKLQESDKHFAYSSSEPSITTFFYPYFGISSQTGASMINPLTDESVPFETTSLAIYGEASP